MNVSLRQLIGDDAANLLLGGSWMVAGVVFIAFVNLRRGTKQSKATCRKQGRSRLWAVSSCLGASQGCGDPVSGCRRSWATSGGRV